MDRRATGRKTTFQKRVGAPPPPSVPREEDKRALKKSMFLVTVNTNLAIDDDEEADREAERFADVLDEIGFHGSTCELWGGFFKVNAGAGAKSRQWLDKAKTKPNPHYRPNQERNSYYEQDDKQGREHWCSFMESLDVEAAGVEWAPGTKNKKKRYLHAHLLIKVEHRTRLLVDCKGVKEWVREKMGLPHDPYVHVDFIKDNTQKALDYVLKNAWNRHSEGLREKAEGFF